MESAKWGFQNIESLTLKFLRVARGSLYHNFSCIEAQAHPVCSSCDSCWAVYSRGTIYSLDVKTRCLYSTVKPMKRSMDS